MKPSKFKISIKKIEKIIGKKLTKNRKVLGIDVASKSGWALVEVKGNSIKIDVGTIDLRSIKDRIQKYDYTMLFFKEIINPDMKLVIEESFLGFNPKTFQLLSRLSAIIYTVAKYNGVKDIMFITATSARKRVGIRGKRKKKEGAIEFVHKFMPNLKSDDVSDGIILALVGLIQEPKLNNFLEKKRLN